MQKMVTGPVVLRVPHYGEAKIVGKVLAISRDRLTSITRYAFLHEESGSQGMTKYGGPGIDVVVVYWCIENGVVEYHHKTLGDDTLYAIRMDLIPTKSQRKQFDGRDRFIVPWESFSRRPFNYGSPWVHKEIVLDASDVSSMPPPPEKKRSKKEDPGRQEKPKPDVHQPGFFDDDDDEESP